jgi:hypothetical protein
MSVMSPVALPSLMVTADTAIPSSRACSSKVE